MFTGRIAAYLVITLAIMHGIAEGQLWRADYFKDEIMRFTTYECWKEQAVDAKAKGVTRIAIVGDSTTLGVGSSRSMLNFMYDYHFQLDGSKAGYGGYPYLLHSLLKVHNASQAFEVINFASDNFTLYAQGANTTYKDLCEYGQLKTAAPDIVIAMLGAKESLDQKRFSPEDFSTTYTAFIKEMQGLPSKPEVLLVSPVYSAKTVLAANEPFRLNELDGGDFEVQDSKLAAWPHAKVDMSSLVAKIGRQAGIPEEQIVDAERHVRFFTAGNAMADAIHPNEVGYGALAQELYMRLATAAPLQTRIARNYAAGLGLPQLQQFIAKRLAEGQFGSLVERPAAPPQNPQLSEMMSKLYIDLPS